MRADPGLRDNFISRIRLDLANNVRHNKRSIEKLAKEFDIHDKTEVKEFTELSIVLNARGIARSNLPLNDRYQKIVELYESQVNLSHRTSHSMLLQQYSTPAPISFLAGVFVNANADVSLFEPSAGNGLLTVAADPKNVVVNEIDSLRNSNLSTQGYKQVLRQDATQPFNSFSKSFDAVITNPPFGRINEIKFEDFRINSLEHIMALRALDTMKDNGKAAIIIGGHNRYDKLGRFQKGGWRYFFNYLYSRYNVLDIIQIDGHSLYSRQGTSFDTRLILISGRKPKPSGAAPLADELRDRVVNTFEDLYERVIDNTKPRNNMMDRNKLKLRARALALELELLNSEELGMPYTPGSESCNILDTVVPDSMGYESHYAVHRIKEEVGGDLDEYVRAKLQFKSKIELCKALAAEQIDAVALAIYNIEERGQAMIIGDQTGIGKGRVAASVIRYGVFQGLQPIFLTEKANLFSDIYRDLAAIGSSHLVPFIVNGKESKTDIKDENGNVVYEALPGKQQEEIFTNQRVPRNYNFILATYSQFNSPAKKPMKPNFLLAVAEDNIVIMDEAHNSSGQGNTGVFMQAVLSATKGATFLSATFAKRADNMPIYAIKTAISEASMPKEDFVDSITRGGVALQEILASQLVAEGQMIRRERSFEGVEVNYITLEDKEQEHRAISDNVTEILRGIIAFQSEHIAPMVEDMDRIAVAEGKQVDLREGTNQAGVDNLPYFSKVFNVIHQMLFSIKAEAVAERAIMRLKEGKKPVIAFASTMGSFIEQMENERGLPVGDGDVIDADFSSVLQRGLDGIFRYSVTEPTGETTKKSFDVSSLSTEGQMEYNQLNKLIKEVSIGITISPIDIITQRIEEAGYTVAEVTGRKYRVQFPTTKELGKIIQPRNPKTTVNTSGLVLTRKRENTNDAFRRFNNNEVDVLLINQSGSTGASAHAIPTTKVTNANVKQRVMIVLQAELDISTEVQKRGRINRTGQIFKPIYDYVNSAIPAEQRLMMMLQKKLKSLDANTTSNQKSSTKILDVPDFLNKYGDMIVEEYLKENPEVNFLLDDPLKLDEDAEGNERDMGEAAHKVSGRVAVLSTEMQQQFYTEVATKYSDYVEYLKQTGDYDLEVEAMDLKAETISQYVIVVGKGGTSAFGDDSILETVNANVLRKPFTVSEMDNLLTDSLKGISASEQQDDIMKAYEGFVESKLKEDLRENNLHYTELIKNVPEEKKLQKLREKEGEGVYQDAVNKRKTELEAAQSDSYQAILRGTENRKQYIVSMLKFFYTGRNLFYPVTSFDAGQERVFAVFLGFMLDHKKKNPYAPSAIRLRFALSSSNKYLAIPGNFAKEIEAIKGASIELETGDKNATLTIWGERIQSNAVDRKVRHIVTGNLLQAFGLYKGKLVSYTTMDGETKKGILMPESWAPPKQQSVSVPIIRAVKVIKSLTTGSQFVTNNEISFFRQPGSFKIIVPSAKSQGGDVFLDEELLKLVENENFERTSGKMVAQVEDKNIEKFINVLQEKLNVSVTLTPDQFNLIKGELPPARQGKAAKPFVMPAPRAAIQSKPIDKAKVLRLRARALELQLELLKF